jgi:hypothetical protein
MAEKQRYTVSLPDHVTTEIEKRALSLSATPTEYAAAIIRWWFGQGCPPVTPDEEHLRRGRDVHAWSLDPKRSYLLSGDDVVQGLMLQLNVPNLFVQLADFDEAHAFFAFDNHPTHWILIHLWKGLPRTEQNGLFFEALPKKTVTRAEMLARLKSKAHEMGHSGPIEFSQLPPRTTPGPKSPMTSAKVTA